MPLPPATGLGPGSCCAGTRHRAAPACTRRPGKTKGVATMPSELTVNGRTYRWMDRPLVVVCVDGCQHEYITAAVAAAAAPFLGGLLAGGGTFFMADCVMARFSKPQKLLILTGGPPPGG